MPSDAKVPEPQPRGITVPAGAVVILVLTGAIWGVGLFLLGRQTAPPVEVLDHVGEAHVSLLNRIDQAIAQGDLANASAQLQRAVVPAGPIGKLALDLRQIRIKAVAAEQASKAAELEAMREAALPEAVLKRLHANLWQLSGGPQRVGNQAFPSIKLIDLPIEGKFVPEVDQLPNPGSRLPSAEPPLPSTPELAELTLLGVKFVPVAQLMHPTIAKRAYALHPTDGLLRSDDGGATWRVGLQPLRDLLGHQLMFTSGDRPLLVVIDRQGHPWLFNDADDACFP